MTERIVRTTLQVVVANYVAGMQTAAKETVKTRTEAERLAAQGAAFTSLGTTALKMGAVIGTGLALAIVRFAEFDQAMSQVQAATQASAEDMGLLRDAALDAGATTVYTATEAANAIEELGKAGLTTAQIIGGGLTGALTLAAAGGLEVADAATYMATSLKQFGEDGSQASHVADLLAAGAGKAVGDVSDLAQALNQAGLIANGAGFSIEETTGVLAAFADAGLLGSDAGTSLKTAIVALQAPTGKAAELLEKYKINVYDANGEMLGFADIAGQLETKLGDLDDQTRNAALATIFGTDALRSANVLYTQGAEGIQRYIDQTNDSGYAAKVAADRLNNLAGDVEKLGGSFDTVLIKTGSGANDVLRELVQSATYLVDAVGEIPEPVLAASLAFGTAATAILLTGGATLVSIPKFVAAKLALAEMGTTAGITAIKVVTIGGALGLATIAIGYFVSKQAEAAATTNELKDSLDEASGATTDYTRELIAKKLAESGAFTAAKEAGISQKELTDAILEGGEALEEVNKKITANNTIATFFQDGKGIRAGDAVAKIKELSEGLDNSAEAFADEKAAADSSADSTQDAAVSYQNAADTAQALTDNLLSLIDAITKANGKNLDARESARALEAAYDDFDAALAENGRTLDITTEKGRANQDALDAIAAAALDSGRAIVDAGGGYEEYRASLEGSRAALLERIADLGVTGQAAEDLADQILSIPTESQWTAIADTQTATQTLLQYKQLLAEIISSGNKVGVMAPKNSYIGTLGKPDGKAAGGAIRGPGTGTSDEAGLFRLSNGEHVFTTDDVDAMGGQSAVYAFRRGLHGGYANGGAVQYAPQGPSGGGVAPVNIRVVNRTGLNTLSGLIQLEIQQDGLWKSVDLDGGLNP